jgi:hypothetical protein
MVVSTRQPGSTGIRDLWSTGLAALVEVTDGPLGAGGILVTATPAFRPKFPRTLGRLDNPADFSLGTRALLAIRTQHPGTHGNTIVALKTFEPFGA